MHFIKKFSAFAIFETIFSTIQSISKLKSQENSIVLLSTLKNFLLLFLQVFEHQSLFTNYQSSNFKINFGIGNGLTVESLFSVKEITLKVFL